MAALIGWFLISCVLFAIGNAAFGHTAGWIAVGVWTAISLLGAFGEHEARKLARRSNNSE